MRNARIILSHTMCGKTGHRRLLQQSRFLLILLVLAAFALRMYRLVGQPLSWDEGWSIGLSSLPWKELNRITALDVHPPLYYHVFRVWLGLGKAEFVARFLSVMWGMLIVPLSYVTAKAWRGAREGGHELVGLLGAALTAWSPFLIYYAQVARMFSFCVALILLATYCLLKALDREELRFHVGFVLTATASLYTFYYSACVLAAALLYALFRRTNRWRKYVVLAASVTLLFLPWSVVALPPMLNRVGGRMGSSSLGGALLPQGLLGDALFGLVFAYGAGWAAVCALLLVLALGLVFAWLSRADAGPLLLPLLAIAFSLSAVAVGAQAHMFAARYLIVASPFLSLAIAWAIGECWKRAGWLGVLTLVVAAASALPTIVSYVYEKPYEVSETFDPQEGHRFLQGKVAAEDVVLFNILSPAGHYERFRDGDDPPWTYVLRWDPVIEPLEPALASRVIPETARHRRLWAALYKGTVAANFELKQWLDTHLFPAFGEWRKDTLYLLYLSPAGPASRIVPSAEFERSISLRAAEFTARTEPNGPITVQLEWSAGEPIARNYKVFVHLYASDGRLVAQHDAIPANDLRPTQSWHPGETVVDRHGLWVPEGVAEPLRLVAGLYDPDSGIRLELADGSDHAELGMVEVVPRGAGGSRSLRWTAPGD